MSSRTTEEEPCSVKLSLALPGILVVQTADTPAFRALTVSRSLRIGRGAEMPLSIDDASLSREHIEIVRMRDRWEVRDLGSRNGTFVNGERVDGAFSAGDGALVRAGGTLFFLRDDIRDLMGLSRIEDAGVVGSVHMRNAFERVRAAAAAGYDLLITGESGTGKELAASLFHASSPNVGGALVDVNCATIPESLAERLLFGARRGAFSGADADAAGLFTAADGGVAFLDEIGELDPRVQAKLLRFVETREVIALGATKGRKVSVQICFATLRDLRRAVDVQRFRADLYHRISSLRVELPALRERREEIPWLIASELARSARGIAARAKFVEACILRPWQGNVRELLGEVRRCAQEAQLQGRNELRASDLPATTPMPKAPFDAPACLSPITRMPASREVTREMTERALVENGGNVAATARALGLHRRQLYRLLERFGVGAREA